MICALFVMLAVCSLALQISLFKIIHHKLYHILFGFLESANTNCIRNQNFSKLGLASENIFYSQLTRRITNCSTYRSFTQILIWYSSHLETFCSRTVCKTVFLCIQYCRLCSHVYRMQSVQNAGLAAVSQASGSLVDGKGYLILITFYLVWRTLSLSLPTYIIISLVA